MLVSCFVICVVVVFWGMYCCFYGVKNNVLCSCVCLCVYCVCLCCCCVCVCLMLRCVFCCLHDSWCVCLFVICCVVFRDCFLFCGCFVVFVRFGVCCFFMMFITK